MEPSQISTIEFFAKIVICFSPLTIFTKKLHRRYLTGSKHVYVYKLTYLLYDKSVKTIAIPNCLSYFEIG